MKKIVTLALLIMMLALSACTERTQYGECIGVTDEKNPELVYKVNTQNAMLGVLFFETLIVPIVVINDCLYCPVRKK
ncbi:hypothetical protein M0R04_04805 [Candidatus Dojkabacteria bacterium]|jgi:hypothetical protein|nr:hypothetical protein [Candidatus Dojkabacteria bacterium]